MISNRVSFSLTCRSHGFWILFLFIASETTLHNCLSVSARTGDRSRLSEPQDNTGNTNMSEHDARTHQIYFSSSRGPEPWKNYILGLRSTEGRTNKDVLVIILASTHTHIYQPSSIIIASPSFFLLFIASLSTLMSHGAGAECRDRSRSRYSLDPTPGRQRWNSTHSNHGAGDWETTSEDQSLA